MTDAELAQLQRRVKARWGNLLSEAGQKRVDAATSRAAVGRCRAGGTASGDASPPMSLVSQAIAKFTAGQQVPDSVVLPRLQKVVLHPNRAATIPAHVERQHQVIENEMSLNLGDGREAVARSTELG